MAELIVALDTPDITQGLTLAQQLQGVVPWVKIGLELFTLGGPETVKACKKMGFKVFLDLKLYDIPNTVRGAVQAAARMGADMLTLHTQGGERMCCAAREALDEHAENTPLLFGVTVLTSMHNGELPGYTGNINEFTVQLAHAAAAWGLDGVVCSGHEVTTIKMSCGPNLLCLTPGIRPAGTEGNDQHRIMTPAQAMLSGTDFLVVGRPITQAQDPVLAAQNILAEMDTLQN